MKDGALEVEASQCAGSMSRNRRSVLSCSIFFQFGMAFSGVNEERDIPLFAL